MSMLSRDFWHNSQKNLRIGGTETVSLGQQAANGGLSRDIEAKISNDRTGWLGREDSNLRMAESKSVGGPFQAALM
jgi:hypothetical protein